MFRDFLSHKILWLILLFTVTALHSAARENANSQIAKKVLLVTIDGLKPQFYLDKRYKMPTLKSLRDRGTFAKAMEPVFPTVTYPNHTTLITGVYPSEHGILANTVFRWDTGPSPAWNWEADKLKATSIFDLVQQVNGITASIHWPVTLGAKNVNFLVPEIFPMPGFYEGSTYDLTTQYTDPDLLKEILQHNKTKHFDNNVELDNWSAEAAAFILREKKPDFTTLHLANVDHVEHSHGPDATEVEQAVELADRQLKTVMDSVDLSRTCVIVVGDHGFMKVTKSISPNVLFRKKGWIRLDENDHLVDWQVIAHSGSAQAAIYVKNKTIRTKVEALLRENTSVGYSVLGRKEIARLGAYPDADFVVTADSGSFISGSWNGPLARKYDTVRGQHGALPTLAEMRTGLVMAGCGYPKGQRWNLAHTVDIAPTITKIMGIQGTNFSGSPLQ